MDQIKRSGRNLSLRKSLVLYIAAFVVLALALSVMTASLCDSKINAIKASYPIYGEKYYLTNEQGQRLGDGVLISNTPIPYSEHDEHIITFLEVFPIIAAPLYSALCIIAAVSLFYRNRLKKPLAELHTASEKISDNDLDFAIEYDKDDELGRLCRSFEIMRATLAKNFSEIWRQVEERKTLNSAFAHDLRTPLTVLKGHNEMLQASDNPRTRETAVTMGRHISRMEAYISSMSNLRRLEDAQPEYKTVLLQPFLSALYENMEIICKQNGKRLCLQNSVPASQLWLSVDTDFVTQVSNNLAANAVRYAHDTITLSFSVRDNGLLLSVADDGKGFDKNTLHKAASPYFTEETDRTEHFGLGLYICQLLCEHHGGCLRIENAPVGAKVTAFFKSSAS